MFLKEQIRFLDISDIVGNAVSEYGNNKDDISLDDIMNTDRETRISIKEKFGSGDDLS